MAGVAHVSKFFGDIYESSVDPGNGSGNLFPVDQYVLDFMGVCIILVGALWWVSALRTEISRSASMTFCLLKFQLVISIRTNKERN